MNASFGGNLTDPYLLGGQKHRRTLPRKLRGTESKTRELVQKEFEFPSTEFTSSFRSRKDTFEGRQDFLLESSRIFGLVP